MGYWGTPYYGDIATIKMSEVRKMIEDDTSMTVTSMTFDSAICIVDDKAIEKHDHWKEMIAKGRNPKNYILIVLWHKSDQIMIKQIGEEMGPFLKNVPLKYINLPCEIANKEWRDSVREFHAKRKEQKNVMKTLTHGDKFTVYGKPYEFKYLLKRDYCVAKNLEDGRDYRIKPSQMLIVK